MKNYSIVRIGDEYIVQANEKSILKITSDALRSWWPKRLICCIRNPPRSHRRKRIPVHQSPLIQGSYLIPTKRLDDSRRFPYLPRWDTSPQREACYLEG
jgi:hypothetical protein